MIIIRFFPVKFNPLEYKPVLLFIFLIKNLGPLFIMDFGSVNSFQNQVREYVTLLG